MVSHGREESTRRLHRFADRVRPCAVIDARIGLEVAAIREEGLSLRGLRCPRRRQGSTDRADGDRRGANESGRRYRP
jgi:hypothetical protein